MSVIVRKAQSQDCAQVLELMKKLAEFEGYLTEFRVTEQDILTLGIEQRRFTVLVAEQDQRLLGMLVYYILPFTYDMKPWIFIKELFIEEKGRGKGVGQELMQNLAKECVALGGSKIKWDVLTHNNRARGFYENLGAKQEKDWLGYAMDIHTLPALAK